MEPQYQSWLKAGHRHVAVCVECHLPNSGVKKLAAKMENGILHSYAFTFQEFHEPIFIKSKNKKILEGNCVSCHANIHADMNNPKDSSCLKCHSDVGHGPRFNIGRAENL